MDWKTGVLYSVEANDFSFLHTSRRFLGLTQPCIEWVPETLYPEVKQQEREADYSSP
jgi:hypothetical protein